MTFEQIEAFLAIVKYGSLTNASERLYLSQSALSHRIAELEKEVGAQLILRRKGIRGIELTAQGTRFLPQAEKWDKLWRETTRVLCPEPASTIHLAATNSLAGTLLLDLYAELQSSEVTAEIKMMTLSYSDAYEKINNGEVDFALLIYPIPLENIETIPIATEELVFVCAPESAYPEQVSPEQLDPEKEVYLSWSRDYTFWHQYWFGTDSESLVQTNQALFVEQFLRRFDAWAIFPRVEAELLQEQGRLRICEIVPSPPPRILYLACSKTTVHPYRDFILATVQKIVAGHPGFASIGRSV